MTQEKITELLKKVKYPGFSRDIVSFGIVKDVQVSEEKILINLSVTTQNSEHISLIKKDIKSVLSSKFDVNNVEINFDIPQVNQASNASPSTKQQPISGVNNVIAVGSGKGGVGKSTVAINIAAELSKKYKVGVLDLDIYGPSLPTVIGSNQQPKITPEQKLIPIEKYGMKFMSFGFINSQNTATIWRGPMVAKLTAQFFDDVIWEDLDYLILDLPPGTGDIQLTLVQQIALTGAIIITTPQDLALIDVKKGADMFKKVNTPVLGVVENMSHYICPHCDKESTIFPGRGGASESNRLDVPLLAQIHMDPNIALSADSGEPYVLKYPDSSITKLYSEMSEKIVDLVSE